MTEHASNSSELSFDGSSERPVVAHRRNLVWLTIHAIVYPFFRLWCRTRVIGREHLDPKQGGVLLINHQSFLDPLFVAVRLNRPVSYLARDSLFRAPLIGWICRNTFVIPISRTAFRGGSIREALNRLASGFLVGIYPEGTRSSGPPKTFRPGFLSLVRRTDVPIYPVAISGADRALPRGAWWIRPASVTVIFGPPLTDEQRLEMQSDTDEDVLADRIRQQVSQLYQAVTPDAT